MEEIIGNVDSKAQLSSAQLPTRFQLVPTKALFISVPGFDHYDIALAPAAAAGNSAWSSAVAMYAVDRGGLAAVDPTSSTADIARHLDSLFC